MLRFLVCFSLLLFALPVFTQHSNVRRLKGLDKKMEEILEATKAPGFAVAVVEKDKIIYERGFGYRDHENKIPVDEHTLFAIGSSTKAFTSAQIGILNGQGKLSLEDSPIKYLPGLRFYNADLNSRAQIKDFMVHRSGIPRHDLSWYFFPTNDRDSLLARMEYMEPFADLREHWFYNNFGFLLQGRIGEVLTGMSWEKNMDELFFTPLNMVRTNCSIEELEKDDNAAKGYYLNEHDEITYTDYYSIRGMAPAGAINSSVHEMSNWVQTWINKGKYNGKEIFPISYAEDAISSHMVIGKGIPGEKNPDLFMSTYGYGWFLSSYRGHYRAEHGGNIDGFSASVCFFPSDSIGIIVLSNQNGSSIPYLVRNTISDLIFDVKDSDWISEFIDTRKKQKATKEESKEPSSRSIIEGTSPSHKQNEYTGAFQHPGYGTIYIHLERDSLFGIVEKGDSIYLDHLHYDVFQPFSYENGRYNKEEELRVSFNFRTNGSGEIAGFEVPFEPTLDPLLFEKQIQEVKVSATILDEYVGEYELPGMTAKFYTKDTQTLYLFVSGQPEYELISLGADKFALKILDGFKVEFQRGDGNQVTAAVFIQPNGTFKATKR